MKTVHEPARDIPVIAEVDVAVVGGGTAGVPAAVAAGRLGAKTMVLERYGHLGGLTTGGLVVMVPGGRKTHAKDSAVYGGVMLEQVKALESKGDILWLEGSFRYNPESLKCLVLEMCEEAGVKLRLHTWVVGAQVEDEKITALILESKAGREAVSCKAVVDATGDADVAEFAGAPYEMNTKRISLMVKYTNIDVEKADRYLKENAQEFEAKMEEAGIQQKLTSRTYLDPHLPHIFLCPSTPAQPGYEEGTYKGDLSATSPDDLTYIEVETRKILAEAIEFYRREVPGYEEVVLLETASQIGTRESRRLTGDYALTQDDVKAGRRFEDAIARAGGKKFYELPYRSLYSNKLEDLFVGGRCISAEHEAEEHIRMIPPCVLTGQAAGTAAALTVKEGLGARDLDIPQLQSALKKAGVALGD